MTNKALNKWFIALAAVAAILVGTDSRAQEVKTEISVVRTSLLAPIYRHDVTINGGEILKLGVRRQVTAEVQPGEVTVIVENKKVTFTIEAGQKVCVDAGTGFGLFGPSVNPVVASCDILDSIK